ncbi:ABC transporter permease [Gilliamella sp. wkB108]|uniref:FecCD family ABC transporter permease n=1 Tax=Gilliamella sp. wkB108 TaxID=3120256 RepID=UPI00080EBD90|nr:iron ABC transporter permease [Gilliamella apicola]OCG23655.1 ABC transporter permease [Gilliamella apicola]
MNNKKQHWIKLIKWIVLILLLLIVVFLSLSVGRYAIATWQVTKILCNALLPHAMHNITIDWSNTAQNVVLNSRLPRILIAGLTGAGLSIAGAALQGVFRNPLVGPQIIGVASGAAFGGVLAILLFSSMIITVTWAFIGGIIAILLVFFLAFQKQTGQGLLILILAGVVVNAFFAALISLITYFADPNNTLPTIVFWLMGSFSTASYTKLWIVLPTVMIGSSIIIGYRFRINALSLGEEQTQALGLSTTQTRWIILSSVTLITSATVAISGTIGWVGLIIPHIARFILGHDHRILLPSSALIGAIYMISVDTIARSASSAEIPLGIITALVGAPIFAVLLRSFNRRANLS